MKRRIVIDLDLPTPPQGRYAGSSRQAYANQVALDVHAAITGALHASGISLTSLACGRPPAGTFPPNPMTAEDFDDETGKVIPPTTLNGALP